MPRVYIYRFLFVIRLSILLNYSLFFTRSRFSAFSNLVQELVSGMFRADFGKFLLLTLFYFILIGNILGNLPASVSPNMLYCITLTRGLLFWVALISCITTTKMKPFMAHLLPYGSPIGLSLVLPLVELFSQLIRPFTLMVRLRTNLSAGHIMMYMFSYFTLNSAILAPFIGRVIIFLLVLEFCICCLQAYIFLTLLSLYFREV